MWPFKTKIKTVYVSVPAPALDNFKKITFKIIQRELSDNEFYALIEEANRNWKSHTNRIKDLENDNAYLTLQLVEEYNNSQRVICELYGKLGTISGSDTVF